MSDVQSVVVGDDVIVNGENSFTVRLDPGDLPQQTLQTLVKKILLQRRRDILEILSFPLLHLNNVLSSQKSWRQLKI